MQTWVVTSCQPDDTLNVEMSVCVLCDRLFYCNLKEEKFSFDHTLVKLKLITCQLFVLQLTVNNNNNNNNDDNHGGFDESF